MDGLPLIKGKKWNQLTVFLSVILSSIIITVLYSMKISLFKNIIDIFTNFLKPILLKK
jgi:hypothetical protein